MFASLREAQFKIQDSKFKIGRTVFLPFGFLVSTDIARDSKLAVRCSL
ncbi:hypothetical protein HMPREF9136_0496 [Prevotella dentalis DSM 3688]|uniref:Uncharacterized protein n=1 Tax=Prevotella dentalis (strain ATCC 49559 / DSM 3688 / JCM 13448 / NCTC 12043 / ES 2772) TaxID=908937 RepID=F9D0W8_PREDD|nr:hypothetical protein HMPREF9136_0496 [Prevotella dentalis DSM 3688]